MAAFIEGVQIVSGIVLFGTVLLSFLGFLDLDGLDVDGPEIDVPDVDVPDADADSAGGDAAGGWSVWSLFSVRPLSAGTFVGATMAAWLLPRNPLAAAVGFVVAGLATAAGTAWLVRRLSRLEEDNTVSIREALYERCVVTAAVIPGRRGAVELTLRGQTVELPAVSETPLAQGDAAFVAALTDGVAELTVTNPLTPSV